MVDNSIDFSKFEFLFDKPGEAFCGFMPQEIFEFSNFKERIWIQLSLIQAFDICVDSFNKRKK